MSDVGEAEGGAGEQAGHETLNPKPSTRCGDSFGGFIVWGFLSADGSLPLVLLLCAMAPGGLRCSS